MTIISKQNLIPWHFKRGQTQKEKKTTDGPTSMDGKRVKKTFNLSEITPMLTGNNKQHSTKMRRTKSISDSNEVHIKMDNNLIYN